MSETGVKPRMSIGDKLRASGGIGKGFDSLRLLLAVGVVAWHSIGIVRHGLYGDGLPFFWFVGYGILTMFFALSGFLIAGSAGRLKLGDFLLNRGLRIFPALAVEILLSAFILGACLTTLPLGQYFGNAQTWHYLTNIVALINYQLPGVFTHNQTDVVNGSLWTVPLEFLCYGVMSVIIVIGLLKRPMMILALAGFVIVVGLAAQFGLHMKANAATGSWVAKAFSRVFVDHQSRLLLSFLLGIVVFCLRDRIPYSRGLAFVATLICVAVAALGPADVLGYPLINAIAAPALTYLMAFIGVSSVPTPALFKRGDYSYGIYLYGFPLQQVVVGAFASVESSVLQFFMALPVIALFSAFSWHVIEKPILKLRKRFSFVSRVRLAEETARPVAQPSTAVDAAGQL